MYAPNLDTPTPKSALSGSSACSIYKQKDVLIRNHVY